eukprot:gene40961-49967_t
MSAADTQAPQTPHTKRDELLKNLARSTALVTNVALINTIVRPSVAADGAGKGIVVLGSSGKTGRLIVEQLSKTGVTVVPALRDLKKNTFKTLGGSAQEAVYADVTKVETLAPVIQGASAVIFAASASSKGGSAEQVDYLGVVNVAKECARLQIPRLVVISSGAITRPKSLGY